MNENLTQEALGTALESLGIRLRQNGSGPFELVVCGGSALILTGAVPRTTKDVDVAALIRNGGAHLPRPVARRTSDGLPRGGPRSRSA